MCLPPKCKWEKITRFLWIVDDLRVEPFEASKVNTRCLSPQIPEGSPLCFYRWSIDYLLTPGNAVPANSQTGQINLWPSLLVLTRIRCWTTARRWLTQCLRKYTSQVLFIVCYLQFSRDTALVYLYTKINLFVGMRGYCITIKKWCRENGTFDGI